MRYSCETLVGFGKDTRAQGTKHKPTGQALGTEFWMPLMRPHPNLGYGYGHNILSHTPALPTRKPHTMSDIGIDLTELLEGTGVTAESLLAGAEQSLRGRGKPAQVLEGSIVRELTPEDVEQSNTAQVGVHEAPPIKTLRDRHHMAAQLIAQGHALVRVSQITGYSQSRLSILQNDPSFANLLATYRAQKEEIFIDTVTKMKGVTDDALELLGERMESNPDSVTNTHLIEIVKVVGDRAGYSPVQKQLSLGVNIDSDHLANIKARAQERARGQVKRITQEPAHATHQTIQSVEGIEVREALPMPQPLCKTAETQGIEG